jgi:hypothetical protein
MSHCPARARTHRESQALLSACSAPALRYLANSSEHSAVWLAHLRPPRALWIAVPTNPERASSQQDLQVPWAYSAAVLRYQANSQAHSAVWLACLRPLRVWPQQELHWLATWPVKSAEVPEHQRAE